MVLLTLLQPEEESGTQPEGVSDHTFSTTALGSIEFQCHRQLQQVGKINHFILYYILLLCCQIVHRTIKNILLEVFPLYICKQNIQYTKL